MLGGAGPAILFVSAIAGLAIVTALVLLHAAHLYVTTITMSSTGDDGFRWPRETYLDWVGEAVVVFGVAFTWAILALFPTLGLSLVVPTEWRVAVWGVILGAMAPISLCCVMSAPSKLLFVYPPFLGRLLKQWKGLVYVYLITTPLVLVVVAGGWLLVAKQNAAGIFVVSVALPLAILLHGRAWGRLSWLALNYDRKRRRKKKKKPKANDDVLDPALEPVDEERTDDRFDVDDAFVKEGERAVRLETIYAEQREVERRQRFRAGSVAPEDRDPPTFETALRQKVFGFVLDPDNLMACVGFSLTCAVALGFVHLMLSL